MTYIVLSAFLGLVALAVAVVPVAVILHREHRAGRVSPAAVSPAGLRPNVGRDTREAWPVAA